MFEVYEIRRHTEGARSCFNFVCMALACLSIARVPAFRLMHTAAVQRRVRRAWCAGLETRTSLSDARHDTARQRRRVRAAPGRCRPSSALPPVVGGVAVPPCPPVSPVPKVRRRHMHHMHAAHGHMSGQETRCRASDILRVPAPRTPRRTELAARPPTCPESYNW